MRDRSDPPPSRPTPAPVPRSANDTCPECDGILHPGHVCKPKPVAK